MKSLLFIISSSILFSCTLGRKHCEQFFSYESKTINIAGLKSRLIKDEKSHEINFGDVKIARVPLEVSDRLKELDLMQHIFCQKISELEKNDPDKDKLQKEIINIFIEIIRLTFTSKNQNLVQMSEYEFQKLRGQRDGYAIGFIVGRLARYYRNNSAFPTSLIELDIQDKIDVLGIEKISYSSSPDDFRLVFAGRDGILNTSDDKIYTKQDIKVDASNSMKNMPIQSAKIEEGNPNKVLEASASEKKENEKSPLKGNDLPSSPSFNYPMVDVQGGVYEMGHKPEPGFPWKYSCPHPVKVSYFRIGVYEVTQRQWMAVMGKNPSYFLGCNDCPVESVSRMDIDTFIQKLNKLYPNVKYRLPTEEEWEYAARGGAKTRDYKYAGGNSLNELGWYEGNSEDKTHIVGGKHPNELGLYDMSGNVAEWCQNHLYHYPGCEGETNSVKYVARGGAWNNPEGYSRPPSRQDRNRYKRGTAMGFRLASDQ